MVHDATVFTCFSQEVTWATCFALNFVPVTDLAWLSAVYILLRSDYSYIIYNSISDLICCVTLWKLVGCWLDVGWMLVGCCRLQFLWCDFKLTLAKPQQRTNSFSELSITTVGCASHLWESWVRRKQHVWRGVDSKLSARAMRTATVSNFNTCTCHAFHGAATIEQAKSQEPTKATKAKAAAV